MSERDGDSPVFMILPLVLPSQEDLINIDQIRELTARGLDRAQPEDRALAWLILLRIYPEHARQWPAVLEERITLYREYVGMLNVDHWLTRTVPHPLIHISDLGLSNDSLMAQVHNDLLRTGRHIYMLPPGEVEGSVYDPECTINMYSIHLRRLERILYILGSINPAMSYMQGFNELLMPFYYTLYFAQSLFPDEFAVEALSFHCLHELLSATDIKELFTTSGGSAILLHRLQRFDGILKETVPTVYDQLAKLRIPPIVYAYRWFCLMFSQDYEMPELQQIWDALFAHFDELVEFEFYVGAAQLEMIQGVAVLTEYTKALEALQKSSARDIYRLLHIANEWWKRSHAQPVVPQAPARLSGLKGFVNGVVPKLSRGRWSF
jgi:hypothetical protein